jgi:hypothetical protein
MPFTASETVVRGTFGKPIPPGRIRVPILFLGYATSIFDAQPWLDCTRCFGRGLNEKKMPCQCVIRRVHRAIGYEPKRRHKQISITGGLKAARAARRRK